MPRSYDFPRFLPNFGQFLIWKGDFRQAVLWRQLEQQGIAFYPQIVFFVAHESHELTRIFVSMNINGDLFGRTNWHECNDVLFRGRSCGVVPSRHIVLATHIRALRTRLPSLRSVLPSRQIVLNEIFLPTNCTNGHESLQWIKMATGSVALICTNAMRELFLYDDNLDNF